MKKHDPVIYKVINRVNGKIYVGKDIFNNPTYFGSGLIIMQAIKKYGISNFTKEVLEHCKTLKELNIKEQKWIRKLRAQKRGIGYNIMNGGDGGDILSNHPNKDEIKKKIAKSLIGRKCSKTTRDRISKAKIGKFRTEKQKINIRLGVRRHKGTGMKGHHHTKHSKRLISQHLKGIKLSKESRLKISIAKKGLIHIFNPISNIGKCIRQNEKIPEGFEKRRRPSTEKTKRKIRKGLRSRRNYLLQLFKGGACE
jgi:group I intron endonuclease